MKEEKQQQQTPSSSPEEAASGSGGESGGGGSWWGGFIKIAKEKVNWPAHGIFKCQFDLNVKNDSFV